MDKYDEKAREVCPISQYGHDLGCDSCCEDVAQALREAAAEALEEAAKDAQWYTQDGVTVVGLSIAQAIRDTLRAKAAALRSSAVKEKP